MKIDAAWVKDERGSSALFAAFVLVGLLAGGALAVDGGKLYVVRSELQKAANAAALSGAQELTTTKGNVESVVRTVLDKHRELDSLESVAVEAGRKVSVTLERTVSFGFARLFGMQETPVSAKASAELGRMSGAKGAAPLGIDEAIPLEYNKEYKLKVDQTEVSHGNFGILALGGPGASTYEDNLRFGYKNELLLGDKVDTQTGNIAGKTRAGVKERIELCGYPPGEMHHRDCPRVLLVPVYRPLSSSGNQIKSVEIRGFAYFYISEPMSANDTAITGKFIQRTGSGVASPGGADKGAYTIRLTE